MTKCLGIDLNGLVDGVFNLPDVGSPRQGEIPSVVVLPSARRRGPLMVVGGTEAIRAIEGRGWEWPESARNQADSLSLRIPVWQIIRGVLDNVDIRTPIGEVKAAELLAASMMSLRDQAMSGATEPVMVLRDNRQFDELVQQRILDALAQRRASATLLWRPVASLLGIIKDLGPSVRQLYGKRVGIVSIMADGIDVSSMKTENWGDEKGEYLVPVRDRPGIHIPFDRTLFDCAAEVASRIMPGDPAKGWQVLWGNGLALQRLVGMEPTPRLLQTKGKWILSQPEGEWNVNLPRLDERLLPTVRDMLEGVALLVFEGPASEARGADGEWLTYQVEKTLGLNRPVDRRVRRDDFVAARGAAEYALRRLVGRHAYFDFLPQIRIVASVDNVPTFKSIIRKDDRVEGGATFRPSPIDLGLSVKPGATRLEIFLTREGDDKARKAVIEIGSPPQEAVPVRLGIEQRPVQGMARLTLIPEISGLLPSIDLDWHRMIPDERSEEQIIEDLSVDPTKVPPLAPVEGHWSMWNYEIRREIENLHAKLKYSPIDTREKSLDFLAKMLLRRTQVDFAERKPGDLPIYYRMLSTDGRFPEIGDPVPNCAESFTRLLEKLNGPDVDRILRLNTSLRSTVIRFGSWSFLACPDTVRFHLLALAKERRVISSRLDFRAMGRVFSTEEEILAFVNYMASLDSLNLNHLEALLSVFSLRANAGHCIDTKLAERITLQALKKLESIKAVSQRKVRTPRACIKLLAGLLRHRMRNPRFLQPGNSNLADRLVDELTRKMELPGADDFTRRLAQAAREFVFEQGSDTSILSGSIDSQDDDGQDGADDDDS